MRRSSSVSQESGEARFARLGVLWVLAVLQRPADALRVRDVHVVLLVHLQLLHVPGQVLSAPVVAVQQ